MTKEERKKAIDALKISAPVRTVTQEEFNDYIKTLNKIMDWLEQEPCGDLISRQQALISIKNLYPDMPIVDIMRARRKWLEKYAPYFECENAIEQLPSVKPQEPKAEKVVKMRDATPEERESVDAYIKSISKPTGVEFGALDQEPKTGHWIIMGDRYIKCSECGHITKTESPDIYHFCMVCGANMSEDVIWYDKRNYSEIVVEPQESEMPNADIN